MFKKYDDFIEKLDKKLSKIFDDRDGSPLNYFLYSYYVNLKGNEINEALENVEYAISNNNETIIQLKEILNQKQYNEKIIEIINNSIYELEYSNTTNEEIIKVLNKQQEKANKPKFSFKNLFHKIVRRS